MQEPSEESVLGDFDDAQISHFGVTSHFFRRGEDFFVRTDGPDGNLADYKIAYVFGVEPLQQYLIGFPGGRYQALGLAWDSRSADQGGQRWFHLYPNEPIRHDDELHWTGASQNWNFMCAECHATNLRKRYDADADAYATSWSELDVSCEACHGPGSTHVSWARTRGSDASLPARDESNGLVVHLNEAPDVEWMIDAETGNATRRPARASGLQVETCARCHARRSILSEDYSHGKPLLDTHRLAFLSEGLYFADGQIQDEVYVLGSFLQSRMHAHGVTCSDCHDPHSAKVYTPGNALCNRCHLAAKFDTRDHHFHDPEQAGARCVGCHMPERLYMVVDPRRDHSIRVPRPDLSPRLNTPNACNTCHEDRSVRWAIDAAERWWGRPEGEHYGEILWAGRKRRTGSQSALRRLAEDVERPGIVRATALSMLRGGPYDVIAGALGHDDSLLRLAALTALASQDPAVVSRLAAPMLDDPVRGVRIEAARLLAGLPVALLEGRSESLEKGIVEYEASQRINADRAEAGLNLGLLHAQLGRLEQAEIDYRQGLARDPSFIPLYANLADLYRMQESEDQGERVLLDGLGRDPKNPELLHALGLLLVRRGRLPEALPFLEQAAEARPEFVRFAYVFAIALESAGEIDRSLAVLESAHAREPGSPELLVAAASFARKHRRHDLALKFARKLVALSPGDPRARQMLQELEH
jgi:tetratricopeptide (TPR) repeat protein